jgi:hypothetical protein
MVDERGVPMVAAHACKGKVRYRYYVSRDLHHSGDASTSDGWRLPAREIEPLVRARLIALLNDPIEVIAHACSKDPSPDALKEILARGKIAAEKVASQHSAATILVRELLAEVRLGAEQICIAIVPKALANILETELSDEPVALHVAALLKRRGHVMKLITATGTAAAPTIDRTLVKAIVQGRRWWQELLADANVNLRDIARRENVSGPYIVRLVRLAFLSPDVLGRIVDGTLPAHLTVKRLTAPDAISARWDRQFA